MGWLAPLFVVFAAPGADQALAAGAGRVRVATWDFGTQPPGKEARYRFTITNDSSSPWTVKHVSRTCSCTVGEFAPRTLKPGEAGSLEVCFRVPKEGSKVNQSLVVEFEQPGTPLFYLVIQGQIRAGVTVLPEAVAFGRVSPGNSVNRAVDIRSPAGPSNTISQVVAPDWLTAFLQTSHEGETAGRAPQAWQLNLVADTSRLDAGCHRDVVTVYFRREDRPVLIRVTIQVTAPLTAVPGRLAFGRLCTGSTSRQKVLLQVSPDLGELHTNDLAVSHNLGEALEVQVIPTVSPDRWLLVGEFRAKQPAGPVEGELEIRTRKGAAPPLRIKVSAKVR